jgi:hypothetical protein
VRRIVVKLFIVALIAIVIALIYYRRANSGSRLNVEPNAAREIEKAKGR